MLNRDGENGDQKTSWDEGLSPTVYHLQKFYRLTRQWLEDSLRLHFGHTTNESGATFKASRKMAIKCALKRKINNIPKI